MRCLLRPGVTAAVSLPYKAWPQMTGEDESIWPMCFDWWSPGSWPAFGDYLSLCLLAKLTIRENTTLLDLSYESRLLQCGLTTLEIRRLRGDQIEVFKIVNGYEDVGRNMFFKLKEGSRTRGHKAALVKEQCRLDMRKYSFSQMVIKEWNKLPNDCVNARRVNMFKNRIDKYLIRAGYT